jgi:hypothetical protein
MLLQLIVTTVIINMTATGKHGRNNFINDFSFICLWVHERLCQPGAARKARVHDG